MHDRLALQTERLEGIRKISANDTAETRRCLQPLLLSVMTSGTKRCRLIKADEHSGSPAVSSSAGTVHHVQWSILCRVTLFIRWPRA